MVSSIAKGRQETKEKGVNEAGVAVTVKSGVVVGGGGGSSPRAELPARGPFAGSCRACRRLETGHHASRRSGVS